MKSYVLGFYFDGLMENVVLIRKKKPKWQEGLLNGLGGKIEGEETGQQAMQREFKEESGVDIDNWKYIAYMGGDDWNVLVYYARETNQQKFESVKSMEDEKVITIAVSELLEWEPVSNLQWLIPLCIDAEMYENTPYGCTIKF